MRVLVGDERRKSACGRGERRDRVKENRHHSSSWRVGEGVDGVGGFGRRRRRVGGRGRGRRENG